MNKTKLNLASTTIFQVEAGEQKAIRDGGDLYLLVQSEEGFEASGDEPEKEAKKPQSKPAVAEVSEEVEEKAVPDTKSGGNLTEAEMQKMSTEDLLDVCDEMGIDPAKYEGKNTNRKLRLLILDGYENGGVVDEAPTPAKTAEVADDTQEEEAPRSRARRGAPKADEPEEIPREKWDDLKEGEMVLAKLKLDDEEESAKLWEAQIIGWDTPKGVKEERLFVLFMADDQEDYLRDEDALFVYKKQL